MRLAIALVALLAVVVAGACAPATVATDEAPGGFAPQPPTGMAIVHVAELPPEAAASLALIDAGGPFPFRQDGAVFQNREGLLPKHVAGHYLEYTVPTPGDDDRGARRIVTGADGERYWTADHYASFAWIAP
jgi:ribonuclease T1